MKKKRNEYTKLSIDERAPVLEVKDLTIAYVTDEETVEAVNHISFTLEKGKTLGLVGETGAGKTSTAKAIMHILPIPPTQIRSGEIRICGQDILNASPKQLEQIRGKYVSMIFQDPMTSLNPVFTVGEQIAEAIFNHEGCPKAEALERAGKMLEIVGIPKERGHEYPHQFSGGMKQRVVIAIALACNPSLLIADEPTTALDVTIQAQVLQLMKDLREKQGTSMIMITHDLGIVAEICDEVAVMYAGRIVERGTLEEVFNQTRHPYTEGLFGSLPNINDDVEELTPIPGLMPDPTDLPEGCAFAPRCKYARPECVRTPQKEKWLTNTHCVMCSAYEDPDFLIERSKYNG